MYFRKICVEVHDDLFLPKKIPSYLFFKDYALFMTYYLLEVTVNGYICKGFFLQLIYFP